MAPFFPLRKATLNRSIFCLLLLSLLNACDYLSDFDQPSEPIEIITQPADDVAVQNLANMLAADPPSADLAQIYGRHNNVQPALAIPAKKWQVGDTDSFFYTEQTDEVVLETTAEVVYSSDKLVMWLEEGASVRDRDLQTAVETLENDVLPTTRASFGNEPTPGIDGDPAIHILHIADMGGPTIGYFSGKDEYVREVAPFSNQHEMFYINLEFVDIGERDYFDVVAHEFQHMIHWNLDRNEQTWVNEGLSELSSTLNGYGGSDFLPTFLADTDTSLTAFSYEGGDYAAAWLMISWLNEKYGSAFVQDLVRQPQNGVMGINTLLSAYNRPDTFNNVYADWTVAVYGLDHNLTLPDRYSFEFVRPYFRRGSKIEPQTADGGKIQTATVGQFGTDFWRFPAGEPMTITLTPSQQVRLINGDPASGSWYWTTVPIDFSDMHLTHPVDLSGVETATLNYQAWFDIEVGYDYGYVSISADGGKSWQTLLTTSSSDADPHGKNLGNGITGVSGDLETAGWVPQSADLTPWAGKSDLLIRFEYITDDAVQHAGFAIDDISIPEIDWQDDVESGPSDWQAAGFVRHTNRLPQTFIVQTIVIDEDQAAEVIWHEPTADGSYQIPAGQSETILAISGSTPVTYQPAGYQLVAQPAE